MVQTPKCVLSYVFDYFNLIGGSVERRSWDDDSSLLLCV